MHQTAQVDFKKAFIERQNAKWDVVLHYTNAGLKEPILTIFITTKISRMTYASSESRTGEEHVLH